VIFDGTHQTPHYVNNGIPFYSIENIVSDKPCKYIAQDEHMSNTRKNKTEKGDILITRIGTIGFAKIVDWDGEFSTYVSLATIKKSSLINTRYLLGYLQSEVYQKEMRSKSLMNAVPCKINMEDLKNTRIAVPKEQQEQENK
jgi:type I restriction enzyme S subunit